jgi:hypothetical protein
MKEQVAKMSRFRLMGVMLLAVFALGAVVASAAQAEEAPFWTIGGSRLKAGKTHNITAKTFKEAEPFVLSAGGVEVSCTTTKLKPGVLLGSEPGEPGLNDEVVEFSGCKVTGNGEKCKEVESPIVTNVVKSELVLDTTKKKLLTEFLPNTGAAFVKLKFEKVGANEGCTFGTTTVEGSVAGEDLTDPGEAAVEVGQEAKEAHSWLTRFPKTQIKEVWLIKGGVGATAKVGLKAFGLAASLVGTALVLLANSKFETEESGPEWSPLP